MQVLEKILEEIDGMIRRYKENPRLEIVDICYGLNQAKRIIHKHMTDGWIPVDERLPEEDGFYMATMDGEITGQEESFVGLAELEDGNWVDGDDVIAWRPLPDPYRQERSEE